MSAFLDISDAVVTALTAPPALCSGNVLRGRAVTLDGAQTSGIEVRLLRSRGGAQYESGTVTFWTTEISIEIMARAAAGDDGEETVDAIVEDVFERMAQATPPAGVELWTLDPAIDWEVDESAQTLVRAGLVLAVHHYTGPQSLGAFTN